MKYVNRSLQAAGSFELSHDRRKTGADRCGFLGDHMAEREARTALRNAAAAVPDQRCRCGPDAAGGALREKFGEKNPEMQVLN